MRVLLAGSVFRAEWTGGEPWVARTVADGLTARGLQVTTHPGFHDLASIAALSASPRDWDPVRVARYRRLIESNSPDVVLGFYDYDSSLCRATVDAGVPFVSVVHIHWPICPIGTRYIDGVGVCDAAGLSKCLRHMSSGVPDARLPLNLTRLPAPLGFPVYLKFSDRPKTLRRASATIVLSQNMAHHMAESGFGRLRVVPNGVDLHEVNAGPWPASPTRTLLLPSTSQSERKGTTQFRTIAARLKARRSDVRFLATNFASDGIVEGTGLLSRVDLLAQYAASYAVIVPVLWEEPFGLVALEAMATGRPVIAYDSGALPEIVENEVTGLIVPRGDLAALERAVEHLLDDEPLARRLGAAGRRRAESVFGLPRMIDGYLDVIRSVAGPR
jgi:glycosyltransferase involved in cell wall biosynthesis